MRSTARVWLLCVALICFQEFAENQLTRENVRHSSKLPREAFHHNHVTIGNFPGDETDVTDVDDDEQLDYYYSENDVLLPGSLNDQESINDLISQIQEALAWSDGNPQLLEEIRHAIAKVREAIVNTADNSLVTSAPNEIEGVLEAEPSQNVKGLLSKIEQSVANSEDLLKAPVVEQENSDFREPSAAVGNRRENPASGTKSLMEVISESLKEANGIVSEDVDVAFAPKSGEKARKRVYNDKASQTVESQSNPMMVNADVAQAKLLMNLLENPIWAEWSAWSACQGQCGTGYRTRTRACKVQGLCEEQAAAEPCPLKDECENPRGYLVGAITVSVLAFLLVTMTATLLLLPRIQKYRALRWENEREAMILANQKKRGSMPDRAPPPPPRPASTLPKKPLPKIPSGDHVYLSLSEVKVGGKTLQRNGPRKPSQPGNSAEDCVYLTASQINQPKMEHGSDIYLKPREDPEKLEEEEQEDEENTYLELHAAN